MGNFADRLTLFSLKTRAGILRKLLALLRRIETKLAWSADSVFSAKMLFDKRRYYRHVKWSAERQREFDDYWLTNYGARIDSGFHRFFEDLTGRYYVDYFSDQVYIPSLARKLNDVQMANMCGSKTMLSFFLNNAELGDCIPKHYAYRIRDFFYDGDRNVVTFDALVAGLANVGECVLKTSDGAQGSGVSILDLRDGRDARSGRSASEILKSAAGDFVIQERIKEHPALAHLSPKSINTIRITTYICEGKVYHSPIAIRFGVGDSPVDNFHAGGLGIGVKDDGTLLKTARGLKSHSQYVDYTSNPNNGEPFEGYKIPHMDRVIEFVTKNHGRIPGMGMVSWDVVITEDGKPMVIEVNLRCQNIVFAQHLHGRPFFGDNTPQMLKLVKKR